MAAHRPTRQTASWMIRPTFRPAPVSLAEPGSLQPKASGIESFFCSMKSCNASSMAASSAGAS